MINKKLFILFFIISSNVFGATRIIIPYDLETEDLNTDQRDKFQNIQYQESLAIPNQYKGPLKYTKGEEEIKITDVRFYMGAGGRYSKVGDIELESDSNYSGTSVYFNKINKWQMQDNFNYFVSGGLYWRNGFRIELEYSEMTLETDNYGSNFKKYTGAGTGNGIIFNQYLQTSGTITTDGANSILTNNMLPVAEFSVKTYMLNFIFEKTSANSKLRPYVGIGAGMVSGDFASLVNEGESNVLGAQAMVGLAYGFVNDQVVLYLGYRALFVQDMEQTFTRIISANSFNGTSYYNPTFVQSTEKFSFPQIHNIDFGLKFFF